MLKSHIVVLFGSVGGYREITNNTSLDEIKSTCHLPGCSDLINEDVRFVLKDDFSQ